MVAAKRVVDVVVSTFLVVFLVPVFVTLALAVKLSSRGPIFYRWYVVGLNGLPFVGFKFRSMVADADEKNPSDVRRRVRTRDGSAKPPRVVGYIDGVLVVSRIGESDQWSIDKVELVIELNML